MSYVPLWPNLEELPAEPEFCPVCGNLLRYGNGGDEPPLYCERCWLGWTSLPDGQDQEDEAGR